VVNRIKRGIKKLKWLLQDVGFATALLKQHNEPNARRILLYHGVAPKVNKRINARFISSEEFENQLRYFKENFNLVTLNEYFEGAEDTSRLTLSLTFDDGYLNNLTEVLPLLEKHQVPATFFITTIREPSYSHLWPDLLDLYWYTGPAAFTFRGFIYKKKKNGYWHLNQSLKGLLKSEAWEIKKELCDLILSSNEFIDRKDLQPYLQQMNEEQIKQLSNSPMVSIGSHGLYHNCMANVPLSEAKMAMIKSKQYLENVFQKPVELFAYPDGSYNHQLIQLAKEVGFHKQLAVDYNQKEDRNNALIEERLGINPYISFNNQIKCIIDGKY
jgi:peptidoglycan/xylan/chitin deacetylase (PgdA/CDA1 family)